MKDKGFGIKGINLGTPRKEDKMLGDASNEDHKHLPEQQEYLEEQFAQRYVDSKLERMSEAQLIVEAARELYKSGWEPRNIRKALPIIVKTIPLDKNYRGFEIDFEYAPAATPKVSADMEEIKSMVKLTLMEALEEIGL